MERLASHANHSPDASLSVSRTPTRVAEILHELREHYRNPCIHPTATLDEGKALYYLDLSRGAIVAMLEDMSRRSSGNGRH